MFRKVPLKHRIAHAIGHKWHEMGKCKNKVDHNYMLFRREKDTFRNELKRFRAVFKSTKGTAILSDIRQLIRNLFYKFISWQPFCCKGKKSCWQTRFCDWLENIWERDWDSGFKSEHK